MQCIARSLRFSLFFSLVVLLVQAALFAKGFRTQISDTEKYSAIAKEITIDRNGNRMRGTLTMPEELTGKLPSVLILHGFTGQRHENVIKGTNETMYGRTATRFSSHGLVTLRIDFIGSGESDGNWEDTTFSGQIDDAQAALRYLSTQTFIDPERMAVLGLSQGGLVAASTAGRNSLVKTAILWSPVADPEDTYALIVSRKTVIKGLRNTSQGTTSPLPWGAKPHSGTPFSGMCLWWIPLRRSPNSGETCW